GETVGVAGWLLTAQRIQGRRIGRVSLTPQPAAPRPEGDPGPASGAGAAPQAPAQPGGGGRPGEGLDGAAETGGAGDPAAHRPHEA
ncbi:MAG TPA: hypothetical protein VFZ77_20910, partial [Acidimicrobiales bacterium]